MSIQRELTDNELLRGSDIPAPAETALRSGPYDVLLSANGDLRRLQCGSTEIVRRIFLTVRDADWLEVPAEVSDLRIDAGESSFRVGFTARHGPDVRLSWTGTITGDEAGRITYGVDGVAERDFQYCRIGLCVLHPPQECVGQTVRVTKESGEIVVRTLPVTIGIQGFEDGVYLGLFEAFSHLEIEQAHGTVELSFEGDLFEMEDQRNWTDGSFKSYCTPMYRGYPHVAAAGQRFRQSVAVTADTAGTAPHKAGPTHIAVDAPLGHKLPSVGVGLSEHDLSQREIDLLAPLGLEYVRVAVDARDPALGRVLARALDTATALAAGLEVQVTVSDISQPVLDGLGTSLAAIVTRISRVIVCRDGEETTSAATMAAVRQALSSPLAGVPVYGGTNAYFAEINRTRPDLATVDGVSWTITPQIHANDERSMVETLATQAENAASGRAYFADTPLCTSVTLKPPFNNDAANPDATAGADTSDGLPDNVDTRQMSLFGAAWTLGSLKYLLESAISAVSYYQTTGWRGMLETPGGSPPAAGFPSVPGAVFPLYHVFADVADLRKGTPLEAQSTDELKAVALAAELDGTVAVLLANLTAEPQDVVLSGLPVGKMRIRRLDLETVRQAVLAPEEFRSLLPEATADRSLQLDAYAVVRIQVQQPH